MAEYLSRSLRSGSEACTCVRGIYRDSLELPQYSGRGIGIWHWIGAGGRIREKRRVNNRTGSRWPLVGPGLGCRRPWRFGRIMGRRIGRFWHRRRGRGWLGLRCVLRRNSFAERTDQRVDASWISDGHISPRHHRVELRSGRPAAASAWNFDAGWHPQECPSLHETIIESTPTGHARDQCDLMIRAKSTVSFHLLPVQSPTNYSGRSCPIFRSVGQRQLPVLRRTQLTG